MSQVGSAPISAGVDGRALEVGVGGEEGGDLVLALFGLQRAGAVDEEPARADEGGGVGEHARLQLGHAGDVVGALQAQDVGMAADRAGGGAGGVEHDRVEGAAGRPGGGVGLDDLGGEGEPPQVVAQAIEARCRYVDGGDAGAGGGQGCGLAAGRGAQVGDVAARDVAGDARHQGGRRILHPPGALGVAGEVLDAAVRGRRIEPVGSRRPPSRSAQPAASDLALMSRGASRRLASAMRRAVSGAVGRAPALPQPIRDVEAHAVLGREQLRPALGDAAQDGVDELGEAMRAAVAPGGLDGQVDDGVRRACRGRRAGRRR